MISAFLSFIEKDLMANPKRTASLTKADIAKAMRLTKDVRFSYDERIPGDVTLY